MREEAAAPAGAGWKADDVWRSTPDISLQSPGAQPFAESLSDRPDTIATKALIENLPHGFPRRYADARRRSASAARSRPPAKRQPRPSWQPHFPQHQESFQVRAGGPASQAVYPKLAHNRQKLSECKRLSSDARRTFGASERKWSAQRRSLGCNDPPRSGWPVEPVFVDGPSRRAGLAPGLLCKPTERKRMYGDKVFGTQPSTSGDRPSSAPDIKMESALRSEFGRPRELAPEFPWSTTGTFRTGARTTVASSAVCTSLARLHGHVVVYWLTVRSKADHRMGCRVEPKAAEGSVFVRRRRWSSRTCGLAADCRLRERPSACCGKHSPESAHAAGV